MTLAASASSTPSGASGASSAEQGPSGPEEFWQGLVSAWEQLMAFGIDHWKEVLVTALVMLMIFLFLNDASSGRI